MGFYAGAVYAHRLHPHIYHVLHLQRLKHSLQRPFLAPSVHPYIYRVPVPEPLRERPPFAAVFRNIKYGVYELDVAHADIPSLHGQILLYFLVLFYAYFHIDIIANNSLYVN